MAAYGGTITRMNLVLQLAVVVIVFLPLCCLGQEFAIHDSQSKCYDDQGRPQRCIPEFVNAAFNVRVEATNTCGARGPTEYCLQTGATGAKKSCEVCDATLPVSAHPPEYLTDFNNNDNQTWWQSETMYEGIQYPNQVNLTLHLGKAFDITYVRLKFHTSRPESFAIYKRTSEDGDWIPYQYYSATCRDTYNIPDTSYVSRNDETRALCTSEFSDISPLTGGNVAFSTLEGRPSAYNFETSPTLQLWVTATDIRITLDRLNTFGDEIFGDPKVLKSYYYGVSDFAVGGRCKCNGHASECVASGGHHWEHFQQRLLCRCEHKTTGADCDQCLPFYNDQPWGRATASDVHECKPCNCNNRSNKCFFDEELWHQTGHGGHCVDCLDNTDGANCERCKEYFYQREDGRCIPCNCDPVGSRSLQCNNRGQCQCKPGVEGQRCNSCAANFYDFTSLGCRPCGCFVAGSIDNTPSCDHVTGVCSCKDNVEGQRCEQCKPGFFALQTENEFGCLPCFCYGHSSICRSAPGYSAVTIDSTFTRDRERWRAVDHSGKDIQFQYNPVVQNIAVTAPSNEPIYFVAPTRYLGDQRASYNQLLQFTLRIGNQDRQATLEDIVLEGAGLKISQPIFGQGNQLPDIRNQEYKFRLHEHSAYGWNPRLSSHDFLSVISNLTAIKIKATYSPEGTGFLDNVQLETALRTQVGSEAAWIEMCTCPEGYVGQFCESCAPGYMHDPPEGGRFARCVPCNCHGHAEYCDPESGRCICEHHTAGDNCERCAPGYYGNALQGSLDDCQPCPCPEQGACVILPDEQVACLQCPEGYAGHKCDLCVDGYFGDPSGIYGYSQDCRKCDCSGNVDSNAIGNCNTTTGECLKCVANTGGRHCETCLHGFYGDALAVPKGDCKACECYHDGTIQHDLTNPILPCGLSTGQCPCKSNVAGKQCDHCEEGYWNIMSGNGCEYCNCDSIGSVNHSCDINTGQCKCHEGITGLHCDQCKPYHYGFSSDGCKQCECDHIGSLSLQCDSSGQCECRPNVEGRRCERCKENKYNKAAGCVDCPPCYNLVQDAVNNHRATLAELIELLEAIKENPQIIDDEDFARKLKEVQDRVDHLLEDAINASGVDGNLVAKLRELHDRLKEVQKQSGVINNKLDDVKYIGGQGERNISTAEDIIKRAQEALASARRFLETDGITALEKALERSDKFGQQSERMSEIAREARHLAEEQEQEASEIESAANDARNISEEAYKKAAYALDTQNVNADDIYQLEIDVRKTEEMLERTKRLADDAKKEASKAYDDALDLYTDANSIILPDVNTFEMKAEAEDIIQEARRIQGRANETMTKHQDLLDTIDREMEKAEGLLKAGEQQQQLTDEMLVDTDAALAKAKDAVAAGEKTLDDAKKTLETLKGFDQQVQESRGKANDALKKIPEIETLIVDAEEKTTAAETALSGAELDAKDARDIAQQAQIIAEQTSKEADAVRDEAEQTKDRAGKLRDQADDLGTQVADTAVRLKEYEDQAGNDETLAQEALERANQAKSSATDASVKVKNALDTVDDILRALEGLDEIDTGVLDELELRLDEVEQELKIANFDPRMAELRHARDLQNQWMRDYSEEVKQRKKDVANIAEIRGALPDKCYRRVVLEP